MSKNFTVLILLAFIVVLAYMGYKSYRKESLYPIEYTPEIAQKELETDMKNTQSLNLEEQNNSKEIGFVTWEEENGKLTVTLKMENEPEGAVQPAHIHAGSCPNPGAIKYSLTNVVNGKSVTTIDTSIAELKTMLPLAINVHESSANLKNYVACGDFKF